MERVLPHVVLPLKRERHKNLGAERSHAEIGQISRIEAERERELENRLLYYTNFQWKFVLLFGYLIPGRNDTARRTISPGEMQSHSFMRERIFFFRNRFTCSLSSL